jgi:hypothetical protein
MEKNTTALNRAIQRAKDQHNYYVEESLKTAYTEREQELLYVKSIALAEFIDTLAELLPVEREQMEAAWLDGDEKGWQTANDNNGPNHTIDSAAYSENFDDYFTNTYTQE